MIERHHGLNEHELEQSLGDGKGQGSLACCSPWGPKESDTTWWLNNNSKRGDLKFFFRVFVNQKHQKVLINYRLEYTSMTYTYDKGSISKVYNF